MKIRPYTSRPEIGPNIKIDFSQFHPIGGHWPWQCGDLPGGWRTHLRYAWIFRRKGELRAATVCKVGIHRPVQAWSRANVETEKWKTWICCGDCGKRMTESQPD